MEIQTTAAPSWQEVLVEYGKRINNMACQVMALEKQNRILRSALRNLAAHVSEEAWQEITAELDGIPDGTTSVRVEQNLGVVSGNFTGVKIDFFG